MAVHAMKDNKLKDNGGEPCTTWKMADFCHENMSYDGDERKNYLNVKNWIRM